MRTAVAQIEVIAAKPEENFKHLEKLIKEAKEKHVELLVLPELCLSGHLLADLWFNADFTAELASYNEALCKLSDGLILAWGNILEIDGKLYNVGFLAENKKYCRLADKTQHYVFAQRDNYDTFNDARYFANIPEKLPSAFVLADGRKVVLTVGEYWLSNAAFDDVDKQASTLINIVNSPYRRNKKERREEAIKAGNFKGTFVYCNRLGLENNGKNFFVYDGDCQVYQNGQVLVKDEGEFVPSLLLEKSGRSIAKEDELIKVLIYAIRALDRLLFSGKAKWIIGLSGGLDSSLNAALLVLALGNQRVLAYNLPSRFNSSTTKNNAKKTAECLDISYHEVSIEKLVEESIFALSQTGKEEINHPTIENIQARIRGHLLSGYAAFNDGVIINNGNKLEVALGYYTLYGDSIGAIATLGDLLKVELFDLARQINRHCASELIPANLIPRYENYHYTFETAPSAELQHNQLDPMKWGYHDALLAELLTTGRLQAEALLRQYLLDRWQTKELGKWKDSYFSNERDFVDDFRWFIKSIKSSVFKRIQAIPLLSLTDSSFGGTYLENQGSEICSAATEVLLKNIEDLSQ